MNTESGQAGEQPGWGNRLFRGADRLRRRLMFLAIRWLIRICGFDRVRSIGAGLAAMHYAMGDRTRRDCLDGLAALLGRPADDPVVIATLRESYRVSTIAVLEVLSMIDRRLEAERVRQQCRIEGVANLEAARTGRGAILLVTHSGNSLLLAAQLAAEGWPVSVVYHHTRMMSKQFFEEGLPRYGVECILANDGFRAYARMMDALRKNRVLFAMMDQGVEKAETGLMLRFLGKDMPMPAGVVQLARQTRAPIIPVRSLAADPVWHFSIEPRLNLAPGGSVDEDTVEILRHMEGWIGARPQLWSWAHRRWREFPVAEGVSPFPRGPGA